MDNHKNKHTLSIISKRLPVAASVLLLSACVGGGSSGSADIPQETPKAEIPVIDVTGKVKPETAQSVAAAAYRIATFMDKMMKSGFIVLTSKDNLTFEIAYKNRNTEINKEINCGKSGSARMVGDIGTFTSPGNLTATYKQCLTSDGWYLDGIAEIDILEIYSPKGRINEAKAVFNNVSLRYPETDETFIVKGDVRAFYEIMTFDSQGEPVGGPKFKLESISNELTIDSVNTTANYYGVQLRTQYENRETLVPAHRKGFFNTTAEGIFSYNSDIYDSRDPNGIYIKGQKRFDQIFIHSDRTKNPSGFNPLLVSILDNDDAIVDYYIQIPANELGLNKGDNITPSITLNNEDNVTIFTGAVFPFPFPAVKTEEYSPFAISATLTHNSPPNNFVEPKVLIGDIQIDHFFNFQVFTSGEYTATYSIKGADSSQVIASKSFTLTVNGIDITPP